MIEIDHNNELLETFNNKASGSQQFATVTFDRGEDARRCKITVLIDGIIYTKIGNNKYNPSKRRWSSCVYVAEEYGMVDPFNDHAALPPHEYRDVVKICTIQHKGFTLVETHPVDADELEFLFKRY